MSKLKPVQRYKSMPNLQPRIDKSPRLSLIKKTRSRTNKSLTTIEPQRLSSTDRQVSLYLRQSTAISAVSPADVSLNEVFEPSDSDTSADNERYSTSPETGQKTMNKQNVIPPIKKEFTFTGYDIMADNAPEQNSAGGINLNLEKYITACKMRGLYPVSSLSRQINTNHITIKSHPLGPEGARALCIALVNNSSVEKLDLQDNDICETGLEAIVEMLRENNIIKELRLCENCIGSKVANLFADLIDNGRHLHTLDLSGNNLDDADAVHIAHIIENSHLLMVLSVGHNKISNNGAFSIGKAIALNDTLKELDLQWNHIRGRGTIAIAIGLEKNVALKRLDLSWNGFATEGSIGLGRALASNRTLLELDISNNRIGPKGVAAVLKGLMRNEGLKTLRIGHNPYSPEVAKSILVAIAESHQCVLTALDLSDIVVRQDLLQKWGEINLKRAHPLRIMTGTIIQSKNVEDSSNMGIDWRDPVTRMFGYMQEMGYRVIDLLKRLDKDGSLSVDRQEFKKGMHAINLPLTESQLDSILDKLDADGDGEVDFRELLMGEKEFKRKIRLRKQRMLKMSNVAEDAIQKLLKIDEL